MRWRLVGPDAGSVLGRAVPPPGAATAVTERAARATAPTASGAASLQAHLPMVDLVTLRSCHIGARPGRPRSGDSRRRSALLPPAGSPPCRWSTSSPCDPATSAPDPVVLDLGIPVDGQPSCAPMGAGGLT